ncbi:MAG TPA: paraquat-inducible protein A [Candidatus Limnocylindria bacterium]|nr:paraquat-inducible protein A [Candidatus Limnocylindria bacterium]
MQRPPALREGESSCCGRCGSRLHTAKKTGRAHTAAFALAALIFLIPANLCPILQMKYLGRFSESTVWDGVTTFYRSGMWFLAAIVFCASIVVPVLKLIGLFVLVVDRSTARRTLRTRIYKVISVIGPWAMLDVFLLSVLIAIVKLGELSTITPGPGIFAFALAVLLTILASSSFDPHLIWEDSPHARTQR